MIRTLPSGRMQARYIHPEVPFKDDGTRNYINGPVTFTTKRAADNWLATVQSSIAAGTWKSPEQEKAEQATADAEARRLAFTFGEYAEAFFAMRDWSPNTERPERSRLRTHLLPRWGEVALSSITTPDIKSWAVTLAPGAPGNRKKAYDLFANILNSAVNDDLIPRNPCPVKGLKGIKSAPVKPSKVKQAKREPRALTSEELEKLTAELSETHAVMAMVQGRMGLRIGEVRALVGGSVIEHADGTVWLEVKRSASNDGKSLHVKTPKTPKSVRTLPVPEAMAHGLLEWARVAGKRGILFPAKDDPAKYVPTSTYGQALTRAGKRAGIGHVAPHDLRHTAASILLANGVQEHVVSEILGHTHSSITRRYTHTYAEQFEEAAEVISNLMQRPAGVTSLDDRRAVAN